MKKILITLLCAMFLISCDNKRQEITYIVKFKDGLQMEVVGHYATISKNSAYVMSYDGTYNFSREEILYIIKKQ